MHVIIFPLVSFTYVICFTSRMAWPTGFVFFLHWRSCVKKQKQCFSPKHCLHAITKHHNKGKDHGGAAPVNFTAEQIQGCFAPKKVFVHCWVLQSRKSSHYNKTLRCQANGFCIIKWWYGIYNDNVKFRIISKSLNGWFLGLMLFRY